MTTRTRQSFRADGRGTWGVVTLTALCTLLFAVGVFGFGGFCGRLHPSDDVIGIDLLARPVVRVGCTPRAPGILKRSTPPGALHSRPAYLDPLSDDLREAIAKKSAENLNHTTSRLVVFVGGSTSPFAAGHEQRRIGGERTWEGMVPIEHEVERDVAEYLRAHYGVEPDEITDESTLEGLGLDSLGVLGIADIVENKYGVSLDDERIAGVRTLSDFKDLVRLKIAEVA